VTAGLIAAGDTANFSQLFDNKNAGTGKTLNAAGNVNDSNSGNNYAVTFVADYTGVINQRALTITGQTANNKVYDTTIAATLSGGTLAGAISGDTVSLVSGTGSFADKDAGTAKAVAVVGSGLSGADAGNYTVTDPTGLTANITPASIVAVNGITASNKTYDATATASLNTGGATFTGLLGMDSLNVATANGNFADANAGTGKTVNISGISLGGADAGNYSLTNSSASTTADIAARGLTITADAGQSKSIGAPDPIFTFTVGGLGLMGSDLLTGALSRNPGETSGSYAINQGSLTAGSNYVIDYFGDQFTITALPIPPGIGGSGSPSSAAGLGNLLAMRDSPLQNLAILNVSAPAAGNNSEDALDDENSSETCLADTNSRLNNPNTSVIFNFGIKLPKGVKPVCI